MDITHQINLNNAEMITFDVDWADDIILNYVIDFLEKEKVKSTWFVTHQSKAIDRIINNHLFEVGIHPNFLENSSHGKTHREVFQYFKTNFPEAVSIRPHALMSSGPIWYMANKEFNYFIDSSSFLYLSKNIEPHTLAFNNQNPMFRLPYYWGDNYAFTYDSDNFTYRIPVSNGIKIYNFHPVHVATNAYSSDVYKKLKENNTSLNLEYIKQATVQKEYGTFNFLSDLISNIKNSAFPQGLTLKDFYLLWNSTK